MPSTVVEAVIARFDASTAYTTVASSGGLWFDEIPEDKSIASGPFVVLNDVVDRGPEWTTESEYTEQTSFTFEVYAVGLAALVALLAKIKTSFDKPGDEAAAIFIVNGARVMGCQRQTTTYRNVGERSATGEKVYSARMSYIIQARWTL